jgi:hypothetical protein
MDSSSTPERRHRSAPRALARRDAGLGLVRLINRWLIAGAVAATGAVSAVAAQGFSGHSSTTVAASSATTTTQQSSGATSTGLQSPAQTPSASSSASTGAVSGGS